MKKIKKWKEWSKKQKIILLIIICAVILGTAGIVIYFVLNKNQSTGRESGSMTLDNGAVQASGTTATAILTDELDIESLDTTLYVEDIYLASGQSVEAGEKILKISDESIEEARKELEQKATEADIAYKQQLITYEQSRVEAKRDSDITVVEGSYADTDYTNQLEQANATLKDLEDQVSDAQELVAEYTDAIDNNYYYTYYQVKELQDECNENFELLMKLYEEWGITDSQGGSSNAASTAQSTNENSTLYKQFDAEVTEEITERDEAIDNYESALKKAQYSIEDAKAKYELLNAELQEESVSFEKKKITLQADCDTAKAQAELAESSYETEM